jgi:PEP-CTERM motif
MKMILALCASVALVPLAASQAEAATIVYTISGTGSGSLNSVAFNNAAFTFTLTGDTANLSGGIVDPLGSATASIAGFSTTTLSIATRLGGNGSVIFFSRSGAGGLDLFDFFLAAPVNLATAFGPVTGTGVFALPQFQNVASTGGPLSFDSSSSVQFSSRLGQVGAVPEPGTWGLMLAGFGLVGGAMRRRINKVTYSVA